jgi:hypothetical protein
MIIGTYEQGIEQMKRDISVDRRLKTLVKSIEKIFALPDFFILLPKMHHRILFKVNKGLVCKS